MEEHTLLPKETRSSNPIHQTEIREEKTVPLVLMDWHLPWISLLMKPHKPDKGHFSVTKPQSNMKCPQQEVCLGAQDGVTNYRANFSLKSPEGWHFSRWGRREDLAEV